MKKLLLWLLFFLLPFFYSIYVCAQAKKDCSSTCFSSEIISARSISETCIAYEMKVSFSGDCAHALSHFTVAVPCGKIERVWNSQNWRVETGTDPTTGLDGFKIDNTANFGEGDLRHFTVKFSICPADESCSAQMKCWEPVVAYKASTCVNYQTLPASCNNLKASLEKEDASCYGAHDGSLSVLIEEGQEPYTFLWSDNSTAASRNELPAGSYSVTVRDASGAEVILEETIEQPEQITVSGNTTAATCSGVADGAIDLTLSGGISPYTIAWDNGAETEDLASLAPGHYTVTATDQQQCSTSARFTVGALSTLNIDATLTKPDCNDLNGSIDIAITGGTSPYVFSWSNGAATEDLEGIGAGLYTVTATDASGCSAKSMYFMKENNTLLLKASTEAASCTEASGSIDLAVSGGTAPYAYEWSNGPTTEDLADLASGNYTVIVTDSKGCRATGTYTVSKTTFQVPRLVVQPTCHGDNNGSITLQEPIGGEAPFTYLWSNGETGTAITDLDPGMYSVTITDASGCSRTLTSTISNPSQISAEAAVSNVNCGTDGSFSIDVTVTGGTAPYSFQWSNGSTNEDVDGLQSGSYALTITDAHQCSIVKEVIVEGQPAAWSCLIDELTTAPACGSENNTMATSVMDADTWTWSVESTDGNWSITESDSPSIAFTAGTENSSATFMLTIVKDGCTQTCTYTVSSCTAQDGGGTDPGDGDPGGEPGDGDGEEDNETCETCFHTMARIIAESGGCRTYEMEVNTNGLCRHDLSHWTLAIPCGSVSDYTNSRGWKMESGKDPTTGLYGLKVDGINAFGKAEDSFTVRFTICAAGDCSLSSWSPLVAYKAGLCVGTETVETEGAPMAEVVSVYPNPFDEEIHFEWNGLQQSVDLQIIDQYGNTVSHHTSATGKSSGYYLTLESAALPRGMYYYRLSVDGTTFMGKLSKR